MRNPNIPKYIQKKIHKKVQQKYISDLRNVEFDFRPHFFEHKKDTQAKKPGNTLPLLA